MEGSTGNEVGYSIATDSSGNFYVTGSYDSTAGVVVNNLAMNNTMQSSGFTLPSTTNNVFFILRYNSSGKLTGLTSFNGPLSDIGTAVTTDYFGNFYVTGQYTSGVTIQLNNLTLSSTMQNSTYTLPASTTGAVFILKYNSAGTLAGFTNLDGTGGTGIDSGQSVTTDSSGNFYVTGYYNSTATVQMNNLALNNTMQSSTYTLPAVTNNALFILKYNSDGTLVGFTNLDGSGNDVGYSVATDSSGNLYVTGYYTSTTTVRVNNLAMNSTMQSSGFTLPSTGATPTNAVFILKYNSDGTLVGFTNLDGSVDDIGYGIEADSFGNLYVTGNYASTTTVQVNNLALNSSLVRSGYTLPSTGATPTLAMFVIKYGNVQNIQLTLPDPRLQSFAGSMLLDGTNNDIGYAITTDSAGNMYVTGQYTSTTTVQINNLALSSSVVPSGFTFPAASAQAAFVLKYSFSDTTLIRKNIYLQSPGNYYTINNGPSFLTVGPTSNVISIDWTIDHWDIGIY